MSKLQIVVGGQYGSEAKGHVVQRLTERAQIDNACPQVVRVAGPNAGHTGYDKEGRAWALRQIPVAAVTDGAAVLGIAAGSEIDLPVLLDEYDSLRDAGLMRHKMMWVHGEATIITEHDKAIEAGLPGHANLPKSIGSTGKGIGAARSGRIMREPGRRLIDDPEAVEALHRRGIAIADHQHSVSGGIRSNHTIIEGTQGYGLGLHAGHYPQCTSSNCRAVDFMAMAGVHSWEFQTTEVWVVARIFPIRVAGNSGPLHGETTWEALGLPDEHTTVTKKVRRVGSPDWELVARAVRANGGAPTVRLAVTMMDQMFPELRDVAFHTVEADHDGAYAYLRDIERTVKAHVGMVTTGPNTASFAPAPAGGITASTIVANSITTGRIMGHE